MANPSDHPFGRYRGAVVPVPSLPVWSARAAWAASVVTGAVALDRALSDGNGAAPVLATAVTWALWAVVLVAVLVPSPLSLTVVRAATVAHLAGMGVTWLAGTGSTGGGLILAALATGVAVVGAIVIWSAPVGAAFVQASAYGDERRAPLRVPAAFLPPIVLSGVLWTAAVVGGLVVVAGGRWIAAAAVGAVATVLTAVLMPRWDRFSRRWLVVVPAGVVIHDPVVLGETAMVPHAQIAEAGLATVGTEALDLSGPAAGHLVELAFTEPALVVVRPGLGALADGGAVHVRSLLLAPTRPGAALAALRR